MTDPDNVARHLLLTRQALTPSAAFRQRVRAGLPAPNAASVSPGVAATPPRTQSPWHALRASGKAGAAVGASLLAAGFLAGYLAHDDATTLPPLPRLQPTTGELFAPAVLAVAPPLAVHDGAALPGDTARGDTARDTTASAATIDPGAARAATRQRARSTTQASPHAEAPRASTTAAQNARDELALLSRADRSVRAGNHALALALIGEAEQRFPRSALVEERRAIELMAYCEAGATDAAARAERFLREHPHSVYVERITFACPPRARSHGGVP